MHVEVAHAGDVIRIVDAVADEREDCFLGVAEQAAPSGIDLGDEEGRAPAHDVDVVLRSASVDQEEAVAVGEPALLGGRQGEGLAVIPTPGGRFGPGEAIFGGGQVAAIVFGADGHVETAGEAGDGRFQEAAIDREAEFVARLEDFQLFAVVAAEDGADHAVFLASRGEGEGDKDVAVRQGEALGAAAGVHGGAARIIPFEFLAVGRPLPIRCADNVCGMAVVARFGEDIVLVVDVVADGQDGIGLWMVFGNYVADSLLKAVGDVAATEGFDRLGVGPGVAVVGGDRPVDLAEDVGAGDVLAGHQAFELAVVGEHAGAGVEPGHGGAAAVPDGGYLDAFYHVFFPVEYVGLQWFSAGGRTALR